MDTESIEKLIELFATLGSEAKWAFMAYLGFQAFKVVATAVTLLTIAVMLFRSINKFFGDAAAIESLKTIVGLRNYSATSELLNKVVDLMNASK
jgi:hypothetical protein